MAFAVKLEEYFAQHPVGALALSGGVDSAYLLYAAIQAGAQVQPFFVATQFQPSFERRDAVRLCQMLNVPLTILSLDILATPAIRENSLRRCYYCKQRIFAAISEAAGPTCLLWDGTNASDSDADRPGIQALQEFQVQSPLRLCGFSKAEIRKRAQQAGLFLWDKPAYACLATRMEPNHPITIQNLARVARAEQAIHQLGFRDFRVRQRGNIALLQLPQAQFSMALTCRTQIIQALQADFDTVTLDLEARTT